MARWQNDDTGIAILGLTTDQDGDFWALPELLPDCLHACDPGKPYQKGAVEYKNQLILKYIPKGKSLRDLARARLDWIADEPNQRPGNRLDGLAQPSYHLA